MNSHRFIAAAAGLAIVSSLAVASAPHQAQGIAAASAQCPWVNSTASPQVKADQVLARMTLPEKIGMLGGHPSNGYSGYIPAIPSLCVPALSQTGGPAGPNFGSGATQLPAPLASAATWDTGMMQQYGAVTGNEEYGKGVEITGGPTVNIVRVPEWGRTFESYGEDPYLTSQMDVADIEGIQSQGTMAMVKHLDAYNQETYRMTPDDDAIVSQRALQEIYLPAFQAAVAKGHVASAMCSYNQVNGTYACQNPYLLTDVLRDQFGFPGFVLSDYPATHSTVQAADAGLDIEMPNQDYFGAPLEQAVEDGQVSMATINAKVSAILYEMFRFGLFDHQPTGTAGTVVTTPAHAAFARQVAEQSAVLLKNSNSVLPLDTSRVHSIAVIGSDAGTGAITAGGGSAHVNRPYVATPLQGITSRAGSGVAVRYAQDGQEAVQAAASSDVAIVFAAQPESEGTDLQNLELPDADNQLISQVAAVNPNTVVVLNTGSPATMPWLNQVRGVIEDWYPGQEDGNAIASVLFGDVDPAGHLPVTFPASDSATPIQSPQQWPGVNGQADYSEGLDVGYRWYDAHDVTPLFPFGYGLSYTSFKFSNLSVLPASTTSLGTVQVAATVTNTGSRAGAEVAQLYVGDPASAGEPPRQLKGFQKVSLAAGQSARVHFTLTPRDLSYYDSGAHTWAVPDGAYQVYVGDSSALASLPLRGTVQVRGTTGSRHVTVSAPGDVQAGKPFTVTTTLTSGGNLTLTGTRLALSAPAGWQVTPAGPVTAGTLAPGQPMTASWEVTAPAAAQDSIRQLAATATYQAAGHGASGTSTARTQVTVAPLVTTTVSPQAVLATPGQATHVTMRNTNTSGYALAVQWTAAPPSGSGITIAPASGSATLAPGASATTQMSVTATAPGTVTVPVQVAATTKAATESTAGAYLSITVPYSSLAAAFNNTGISDDGNPAAANFGGGGGSWSAQALAAAGITPGGTVSSPDGLRYTWPDVPVATPDNVETSGQVITLSGSGPKLGFLGAAAYGTHTGTVTVTYTDGSTSSGSITFSDWQADAAPPGGVLVATIPYHNVPSGQSKQNVGLYSSTIPLDPGKAVASITLPTDTDMHIFATAFG